ncbi:PHP domain-containing protein [Clostridium sp. YIM B02515]|uniref:PHP domain-containing protein n=1 Tax=Clostridium rhizosphaerae TaxID=2803861 RepID=A0ABS1T7I1_9CLOT|nr:PHP domain-containing protein [Clostridium rhizosphaerae]MBL4934626.1 PHP domain-containing protein [Clostridium rhizosphaerae]
MRTELQCYDIYPKVLLTKKKTVITIETLDEKYNFTGENYIVKIVPVNQIMNHEFTMENTIDTKNYDNKLVFEYEFKKEQEYYIRLYKKDNLVLGDKGILQLSVYAVEQDLYERIPLKGDLHVHSCRSDGKESPAIVACNYRKQGYDFFSQTDHGQYNPSVEAINSFKDVKIDLNIVNGEEVHSPDNYVHIINFGSEYSVNDIYRADEKKYRKEVNEIMETLTELPKDVDRFIYAACVWVSNKIREANGLSVFCHPFWISNTYNVTPEMSREILNNGVCDAFELLGGQTVHENNMQVALYNDIMITQKNRIPILGNSDSHGTINATWFDIAKTIVFAHKNEKNEIIKSIKDLYSVAVDSPKGESYRVYGSLRLVNYTRFLMENYFPIHDEICIEEGRLMKEYHLKRDGSKEALEKLSGRCDKLIKKYFGVI